MSSHPIPIVDFTPFLDESAKQEVADQLLASFKSAGFVYLTNFGIPEGEVQEMFDWVGQPPLHLESLTYSTKAETFF
jgi:isopenicillin N synthase-like dioxygenase